MPLSKRRPSELETGTQRFLRHHHKKEVTMAQRSSLDVRKNLRGVEFPASREDLRRQAEKNNADEDFLIIMDALPDGRFDTIEAVSEAINEATEPVGGERP
jgi:Protein of unknown function (DUF2795)